MSDDKFVPPVFLKKVANAFDRQEAAALIGISVGHLNSCARGSSPTSLTIELAARYIYEKKHGGGG